MKKVFVTGGTGFLGSHLLRHLSEKKDCQVTALYRSAHKKEELFKYEPELEKKIHWVQGDLFTDNWNLKGFDLVYHLAGYVGYKESERAVMEKVNVEGTKKILKKFVKDAPLAQFVYLSSVVAVGAGQNPSEVLNEDSPYNLTPYNLGYFETKRQAEKLVFEFQKEHGFFAVSLNPSTIYGARDFLKSSRKGQLSAAKGSLKFYPDGGVSLIHVDEVCTALVLAPEKATSGERYILSGDNITIQTLLSEISNQCKTKAPCVRLPKTLLLLVGSFGTLLSKIGINIGVSLEKLRVVTMYHWFSADKMQREFGIRPRSYKECIKDSVQWAKKENLI